VEIMADLRVMLGSLAREDGVFGRVAAADTGTVEEHVYRLVLDAHEAWRATRSKMHAGRPVPPTSAGHWKPSTRSRPRTS
jgi:hypothetical protein